MNMAIYGYINHYNGYFFFHIWSDINDWYIKKQQDMSYILSIDYITISIRPYLLRLNHQESEWETSTTQPENGYCELTIGKWRFSGFDMFFFF